ncbi:MAG: hypothetical protein ACOCP8_00915 [archaeon]
MGIENDVKIWMNKIGEEGSEKSIGIRFGGSTFIAAIENLKKLMNGDRKGVMLNPITDDDIKDNIGVWLNTVGEKSIGFTLGKANNEDATYICAISRIKKLLKGELEGVAFNPIVPEDDNQNGSDNNESNESQSEENVDDSEKDVEDFDINL